VQKIRRSKDCVLPRQRVSIFRRAL